MTRWDRVVTGTLVGGVIGAIGFSAAAVLFCWLVDPDSLKDGQFVLVFFFTVPFGGMLGATTGCATALLRMSQTAAAGKICLLGGGIAGGLAGALLFIGFPLFYLFVQLVWSTLLVIWGIVLLRQS